MCTVYCWGQLRRYQSHRPEQFDHQCWTEHVHYTTHPNQPRNMPRRRIALVHSKPYFYHMEFDRRGWRSKLLLLYRQPRTGLRSGKHYSGTINQHHNRYMPLNGEHSCDEQSDRGYTLNTARPLHNNCASRHSSLRWIFNDPNGYRSDLHHHRAITNIKGAETKLRLPVCPS